MFSLLLSLINCQKDGYFSTPITLDTPFTFNCDKYTIFVVVDSNPLLNAVAVSETYNLNFLGNTCKYVANFTANPGTVIVSTISADQQILYYSIFNYKPFVCSSMDVYIGNGNFTFNGEDYGGNSTIRKD